MNRFIRLAAPSALALGALLLSTASRANAHFLWAEMTPQNASDASQRVQLRFAEAADEPTNGVPLSRLKDARAWSTNGHKLALVPQNDTLCANLPAGAPVAGVYQTWGVVDKKEEGRGVFLLEYSAKAARSVADAARSANLPLELFLRRDAANAKTVVATLQSNGKVVANAPVKLYLPGSETPRELTTDARGEVRFAAASNGNYGLRAASVQSKNGRYHGQEYAAVRHYSTLTFTVGSAPKLTKIMAKTPVTKTVVSAKIAESAAPAISAGSDAAAYALLKAAHDSRQVLPVGFAGFTADVTFSDNGKSFTTPLTFTRDNKIVAKFDGLSEEQSSWIEDQLGNFIGHRRGGDFSKGDGRRAITFGTKNPENRFGRLVEIGDSMKSNYRVKDNRVLEVTRTAGGSRFTISVVETMDASPGKYLAEHFMVSYRDEKTDALQKVDGFRDSYIQIGEYWLPQMRTIISFVPESDTPEMRSIRFRNIQISK